MTDRYPSPGAFRRALEDRLRHRADRLGMPLQRLRTRLAMERLLARLCHSEEEPWLLKGGYAIELRLAPRARTTRDIDLSIAGDSTASDWKEIRDTIQRWSESDMADGFAFAIGPARKELQGAPRGGARYPVESLIAGREFARFQVDVGVGDSVTGEPEELEGLDLLDFIGVSPPRIRSVPLETLFAEKVHAYSRPWGDRANTRVKDLIDLLLLEEAGLPPPARLRLAVERTFETRQSHAVPNDLPTPPDTWREEYESFARDLGLDARNMRAALEALAELWRQVRS